MGKDKTQEVRFGFLSLKLAYKTAVLRIAYRKQRMKTLQRFQGTTEAEVEKIESVLGHSEQHPSHCRHSARPISFSLKVRNLKVDDDRLPCFSRKIISLY